MPCIAWTLISHRARNILAPTSASEA